MNALRLRLFQETACYKRPVAFKVGETYPLPPYSTVKGMLHAILEANEFIPMKLSIQGSYESKMIDYQRHYFFKKKNVSEFPLVIDGLGSTSYSYEHMTTMPIYMHLLYHVKLVIHVQAEEEILAEIEKQLKEGFPISLGRWEDLVRIDDCKRVNLEPLSDNDYVDIPLDMYVPTESNIDHDPGIPYRLNWKYEIKQGVRQWEKIDSQYLQKGVVLEGSDVWMDEIEGEPYPVVFAPN
ncbi:MAG: type I-B CRISPR-associated protein Cas5 [Bacillaceae bacterium]|nr:type I-B CRISPR-associated protein Cas5 [Bacillaceae bacterium]